MYQFCHRIDNHVRPILVIIKNSNTKFGVKISVYWSSLLQTLDATDLPNQQFNFKNRFKLSNCKIFLADYNTKLPKFLIDNKHRSYST